jgi:hypothetical protein
MLSKRLVGLLVALAVSVGVVRPTRAEDAHPPASPPSAEDPYQTRRIVDISLLAGGVAIAAVGGYFATKYDRRIGGCDGQGINCTQEDGHVPLGYGMLMLGGALAVVGAVSWLQIPSTTARVGLAPNGLLVAGSF